MEEIKTSKQTTRQKIVVGGVGGIAGVLILAGAFAAASLIKINKTSNNKKPEDTINLQGSPLSPTNISNKEEGSQGLRSLIQTSSSPFESHNCSIEHDVSKVSSTEIDCQKVETVKMVLQEEISTTEVSVEEQIFICEGKMIKSAGDSNALDGIDMVTTDNNSSSSEEVGSKVLCSISSPSHQSNSIGHEASKAISTQVNEDHYEEIPSLDIDKNLLIYSIEDEGDQAEVTHIVNDAFFEEIVPYVPLKDVDEDDEMEREREDSEGTPNSSLESNSEAVWPTESIEEELSFLKDNEHIEILRKKNDKETTKDEGQYEGGFKKLGSLSMGKKTGFKFICPSFLISSRAEFWLWSLLAVVLLCLFFSNHLPIIYHPNDSQL